MRIIAGEFRGRRLEPPGGRRVRPTAGRVREALFDVLAADLAGAHVVDLFAGSGALGLEALSRGAAACNFVERARGSLAALRANIDALDVADRARVIRADALRFAERLEPGAYDVALADPPYASGHAARLAARFAECPFARILAVEHRAADEVSGDETRRYGDVALTFSYAS